MISVGGRSIKLTDIATVRDSVAEQRNISKINGKQVLSFAMDVADRLFVIEGGIFVHESARDKTDVNHIKAYLSV